MTDIEIANTVKLKPITEIAKKLGIDPEVIELYGKYKAKPPRPDSARPDARQASDFGIGHLPDSGR